MTGYLISEAARRTGVEAHVLRFWEEELELKIPRNEQGHRCYTEEDIAVLKQIRQMKAQGFQLKAIRDSLAARAAGEGAQTAPAAEGEARAADRQREEPKAGREEPLTEGAGESRESVPACAGDGQRTPAEAHSDKLAEFETIVYDIVTEALRNNNERLGREVSERVNDKVVKEMNYLLRENEEHMEEHFRRLDEELARRGRKKRDKSESEAAATRSSVRGPIVSQSKRKRRLFGRKRRTTLY